MIPSDGDGHSTSKYVHFSIPCSDTNVQIPLLAISGVLIYLKVDYEIALNPSSATPTKESPRQKLARIDFLGCFLLAGFVGALLLAVSIKTSSVGVDEIGWSDPLIVGLFGASGGLFLVFLLVEFKFAKEPVLPLELLHRRTAVSVAIHNLVLSILIYAMVSSSEITITVYSLTYQLYSVPLFYTAVNLMSASSAGNHMIPNAFCAAGASLGSGFLIRGTGKYYWLTFLSGLSAVVSLVMFSFWTRDSPECVYHVFTR
jgi:hypothetical protein